MLRPIILLLILGLSLGACQPKPDWKKPTKVGIKMTLQNQNSGGPGELTFSNGNIWLSNITIEGALEEGDDFSFERDFPQGLEVNFNDNTFLQELNFDLPQGNYTDLKIRFETQANHQSIFVAGIFDYNNPTKADAVVNFEVDSSQIFNVAVTSTQGNTSFAILEGQNNNIDVILNPPYWFKNVTSTMMNNSSTTIINSQPHILINRLNNTNLYQDAKAKIGEDTKSTLN